jgi:hypothetical protein
VGKKFVIALCVVALGAGACKRGGGEDAGTTNTSTVVTTTIPTARLQSEASQIVDLLAAAKYDDVVSHFNAELLLAMSATSLKTAWESVAATYGAYKSRNATTPSAATVPGTIAVFDSTVTFGTTMLKCRIGFDADGKVASLRVVA